MEIENNIRNIDTDSLSRYKTSHHFESYAEIKSVSQYMEYYNWALKNNKKIYFLGNGSNTLFVKKNVESLVLKNSIPKEIKCISKEKNLYEVSSTVKMNEILRVCYKESLDSFYYLASVPATIGGALAMNAGEGKHINKSIYDFVKSVTYIDKDNEIKTINRKNMNISYRETMFTGSQEKFIISAIFEFPYKDLSVVNPVKERIQWSKQNQDNIAPNCGSVFSKTFRPVMRIVKGLSLGKAKFSSKTLNWINNKSSSHKPILLLIYFTMILHLLVGKKCKVEVIRVK